MIKFIFSCFLSVVIFTAEAQIEMAETAEWTTIGELKTLGLTKAKMEYRTSGADTIYMLLMKDFGREEEKHYFGVKFNGTDDTYNKFYSLLKSFFLKENRKNKDYTKTFKLGTDYVNLQHYTLITGRAVMLSTKEGHINLSEKDIDKLFGKR